MNFNNLIYKIKDTILRFMQGRYGGDALNNFLLAVTSVILIINLFIGNFYVSTILILIATAAVSAATIRTMSRDIYARQNENAAFMKKTANIRNWFDLQYRKIRDRKTHRYIRCACCKKVIRVKRLVGERTVHCPLCGEYFSVKIK